MKFIIGLSMLIVFFGGIFAIIIWAYGWKVTLILLCAVAVLVVFLVTALSLMTGHSIL